MKRRIREIGWLRHDCIKVRIRAIENQVLFGTRVIYLWILMETGIKAANIGQAEVYRWGQLGGQAGEYC